MNDNELGPILPSATVEIGGKTYPLAGYSASFLEWFMSEEIGHEVSKARLAEALSETDWTPDTAPAEVFDLNLLGGIATIPGNAPVDVARGPDSMTLVGFTFRHHIDLHRNGEVTWDFYADTPQKVAAYEDGLQRLAWCFRECRGTFLVQIGEMTEREEEAPILVHFLTRDDKQRFRAEYPNQLGAPA